MSRRFAEDSGAVGAINDTLYDVEQRHIEAEYERRVRSMLRL